MLRYDRAKRIKWPDLYDHKLFKKHQDQLFKSIVDYRFSSIYQFQSNRSFYDRMQFLQDFSFQNKFLQQNKPVSLLYGKDPQKQKDVIIKEVKKYYLQQKGQQYVVRLYEMLVSITLIIHPNILHLFHFKETH